MTKRMRTANKVCQQPQTYAELYSLNPLENPKPKVPEGKLIVCCGCNKPGGTLLKTDGKYHHAECEI